MTDPLVVAFDKLAGRMGSAPLVVSRARAAVTVDRVSRLSRAVSEILPADLDPGSIVGLVAGNGPAFLAGLIALRRQRLVALLLDPQAPRSDVHRTARGLGARGVLTCRDAWAEDLNCWFADRLHDADARLPESIAVVKVTSGSSGMARGVVVSAEALLADDAALESSMGLREDDRMLAAIPLSHSYGLASLVLPALVRGSVIIVPEASDPLSPVQSAVTLGATVVPTVPAYLQGLLRMSQPPLWSPTIRLTVSAGAPLPIETAVRFRETYGQAIHVFYGSSESGGITYDREGGAGERGTVGTPVDGVKVTLELIADQSGGMGLVTVASAATGTGYLPESDIRLGDGQFQTSDLACWTGGELKLLRRVDGLINIKGKKVDLVEIQTVLASLEGVDEVVALSVAGTEPGSQVVRVAIGCRSGKLTYEEVLAWCRPRLAYYKVPRSILLMDMLPRTSRGKIDRSALASTDLFEEWRASARI